MTIYGIYKYEATPTVQLSLLMIQSGWKRAAPDDYVAFLCTNSIEIITSQCFVLCSVAFCHLKNCDKLYEYESYCNVKGQIYN